jgi:carbonic anhydrase/acetyltransferase-like protein (isoleucine patch superfamily)
VIGKQCLVGAGAIVTEGKTFPDRSLILGAPAKLVRELTDSDVANLEHSAAVYVVKAERYRDELEALD